MRLIMLTLFLGCDSPPQGTVAGNTSVWHYDDADAGVRCYAAENYRWSCVKIR